MTSPAQTQESWQTLPLLNELPFHTMERDKKIFQVFSAPILRFYRWSRPAVSFGRTRGIDSKIERAALEKGWMVVGRPTGGGIVEHSGDLCFSIFWSKGDKALPWKVSNSYAAIHAWIAKGLQELGIQTETVDRKKEETGWCFQTPVCHDLALNGKKIVGGAQWRQKNKALHQGSIQLTLPDSAVAIFESEFMVRFGVALNHGS
ncbi:MAG: hypothetical protein A2901_04860 [Elusimicrobia bacterium RIFCSPLOWO2_01_FULL_54_10]|nr:MAG: hypothetical protein A2901_04860 [Elusimicrobia bacterium RIFCSPLOWO2_01_FULL_54_10]